MTIALVDLDTPGAQAAGLTPTLGPALLQAPSLLTQKYHLEYVTVDNTQFDISAATGGQARGVDVHEWAQKTVHNEDYFGMIIGKLLLSSLYLLCTVTDSIVERASQRERYRRSE